MLRLLALLLLLPVTAWAQPPPGFSSGTITDLTLEYIYDLEHFQRYPNYPQFWFSDGSATGMPAGNDSNPCTQQFPCRTIDKMEEVLQRGQVHVILDADDDWHLALDWTAGAGDASLDIDKPPACAGIGTDQPCFVISASSFSPKNRARITCTNQPATITDQMLFGLTNERTTHGWGAIENIEFENCPNDPGDSQDIVRTQIAASFDTSKTAWMALNLKSVDGMKGYGSNNGNAFYTPGYGATIIVGLNTEAHVVDDGDAVSQHHADIAYFSEGSGILIGRNEWYNLDANAGRAHFSNSTTTNLPGAPLEMVLVGHTLTKRNAFEPAYGISSLWRHMFPYFLFSDVTISGFNAPDDTGVFMGSNNVVGNVLPVQVGFFRTTIRGAGNAIYTSESFDETVNYQGRCLLIDGHTATDSIFEANFLIPPVYDDSTYDLQGLYDDEPVGDHYSYPPDAMSPYQTAAEMSAGMGQSIFATNSVDSGGDAVDGNAFGGLANALACDSADCTARCPIATRMSHTFRNGGFPPLVLGKKAIGMSLGGTYQNFGGR